MPWLRNPSSQQPAPPNPPPRPPRPTRYRQTFQLAHVFAHGAPGSKYHRVFRHLAVDARVRQEMAHARTAWIRQQEMEMAKAYRGPQDITGPRPRPRPLQRLWDTPTDHNGWEYGAQAVEVDPASIDPTTNATITPMSKLATFPWPWPRMPDVKDHETVKSLARMALDCYVDPARQGWVDIGDPWDVGMDIGWMETGLRGYVFESEDKETVIVGIKGTSLKLFGTGGGPTGNNDKMNRVMDAIQRTFPKAKNIWLTGHSLGGSVASMLGITRDLPVVAFQAPGDRLYGERTQLVKPGLTPSQLAKYPVWHIGPTADPIYMGTCNGPTSTCYTAGYAMESRCHLGKVCRYDTVGELGWHQGIQHHTILAFIDVVDKWQNLTKGRETVPPCEAQGECEDCTQWEYV
ncbi:putative lipase atg15 [Actinomortierella ambigua]|uniref:triacylglycerol lipase n=1 Tax=Actinomortierella ambigua TaxID=1343610 RepID=A0A9P6UDB9_9FUNG|nr:putative lipase atg15 [Actinomortierella ambigua]